MMKLEIKDLHVEIEDKEVIKGINLTINEGEFHVLMGPNGSGKTSLSRTVMGHTKMKVTKGDILVDGKSILGMATDKRAKLGLFLLFQNPIEVEGLGLLNFLNTAKASLQGNQPFKEFMEEVKQSAQKLHVKEDIIGRSLNYGFSGGEKKKIEVLQMGLLKPKIAILDEPDSGLDIDAVKIVAENVNEYQTKSKAGILLITHYNRILNYMKPEFVHVMVDGKIVKEGGRELADRIEKEGYKF
jgi:Fe-S cluster assembly ATP-binding protein